MRTAIVILLMVVTVILMNMAIYTGEYGYSHVASLLIGITGGMAWTNGEDD